jgi:energy-coupling factor transport system permease protein
MALMMWVKHPSVFPVTLLWLAAVVRMASVPPGLVIGNIRGFRWILLITFVAHAGFTPGKPVAVLDYTVPLITLEGLYQGALFTLRLVTIMALAALLTLTTAPLDIADALESLLGPFKRLGLPAHELAMTMVIALRFIPTLIEEADRIQKAQMARGADFTGGPLERARKLTALLAPLLLSAFRRADDLALAMEARCYRGGTGRSRFQELSFGRGDALAAGYMTAMIISGWLMSR